MKKILSVLAMLAILAAVLLLVSAPAPGWAEELPVYSPVVLGAHEVDPIPFGESTPYAPHEGDYADDNLSYSDPSIVVRTDMTRAYNSTIMMTWVQIADATQLRTALCAPYPNQSTARVDRMAKREKAVLAINGDYFVHRNYGLIYRNGKKLRTKPDQSLDILIIDDKGDFTILHRPTAEDVAAYQGNIIHSFSFGPALVIDGERNTDYNNGECAPGKRTQRIALCQMDTLSYLIVSTEGPENKGSTGLTMSEFSQLCYDLGAKNAYNLDGGSSSSVVLNYKKVNALSTGKIRSVGDIIYFISAVPDDDLSHYQWTVTEEDGE